MTILFSQSSRCSFCVTCSPGPKSFWLGSLESSKQVLDVIQNHFSWTISGLIILGRSFFLLCLSFSSYTQASTAAICLGQPCLLTPSFLLTAYRREQKGKKEASEQKKKDKDKKTDSEEQDKSRDEDNDEDEERLEEEEQNEEEEVDN